MICTEEITKIYNNHSKAAVLDGVNLHIAPGELVAINGRSGSGKTTLLNILGALDHPTSGRVIIDGVDVNKLNSQEKADFRRMKVGFIFQLFYLIPQLTILENVMIPLQPYRRKLPFDLENRASEIIEWVGLSEYTSKFPNYLSGGEQQRVAIARALINQPKIILADEPTGSLDPETGRGIVELLEKFNREQGITILLVTHNPEMSKIAHRNLYLNHGKIVDQLVTKH